MGFSGKPSKGCAPCRAKRTKCDLALPFCTQCIRKGRECSGYRNEQDLLFRNETIHVVRRAKQKSEEARESSVPMENAAVRSLQLQRPSRGVTVDDEALAHFFAHYNEKFFSVDGHHHKGGLDYVLPVYQQDLVSGGPVPEIIKAIGLAALGNLKGMPELLTAARAKQVTVLRQLNEQLQNRDTALSDSSTMTCVLLGTFEIVSCDSIQSSQAITSHLNGAALLADLRGANQFQSDIGCGIYARIRGFILAHCLQRSDPLPPFVLNYLENDEMAQRDFDPVFYKLLARLCQLRSDHKTKGYIDDTMAQDAQVLMIELEAWQPSVPDWTLDEKPMPQSSTSTNSNEFSHFIWLTTIWLFQRTARILASNIVIEWSRSQSPLSSFSILNNAERDQKILGEELMEAISYYLDRFRGVQTGTRTVGGSSLLWPLYVLSTAATTGPETMAWIAQASERVAGEFGVRQGKLMADIVKMYAGSEYQ
ncbi:hypothetical protein P154DRAFT_622822 [Amniculicola lignicola CBS 123094]|uniref:Zn(2)-C6 fungal-type domain-containing protein n=1 Tax=Amniculicola lignicola CBS 123094 TaxID=1392246 RepID=A0A6A5W843_9PLEO|nr:hypothetical protein P154DRAFT_622822 [Amniculicola lignicola CBS 123094]